MPMLLLLRDYYISYIIGEKQLLLGVQDLQMVAQDDTLILKGNVHLCQDTECYWDDTRRRNVEGRLCLQATLVFSLSGTTSFFMNNLGRHLSIICYGSTCRSFLQSIIWSIKH